jgi:hypothetical protein
LDTLTHYTRVKQSAVQTAVNVSSRYDAIHRDTERQGTLAN